MNHLLEISIQQLNVFSFIIGMLFASTMWRYRAVMIVLLYFMGLSCYLAFVGPV